MGPKRPEWMPKALEYAELERIAQAAGTTDPRARDPWPERDAALFAVFAGAGVRSGEAIAMRVGSVEAAERSPRLRVLGCTATSPSKVSTYGQPSTFRTMKRSEPEYERKSCRCLQR